MGRPQLETKKDKIIHVRLSSSELDFYQQVCKANHLTMSVFIRLALANYSKSLENK